MDLENINGFTLLGISQINLILGKNGYGKRPAIMFDMPILVGAAGVAMLGPFEVSEGLDHQDRTLPKCGPRVVEGTKESAQHQPPQLSRLEFHEIEPYML